MLKLVLAALVGLATPAPQVAVPTTAAGIATAQSNVIDAMGREGMEVSVTWLPCGFENAWYSPLDGAIVLCLELDESPGNAVFAAAHEMGHALVWQLHLKTDGDRWAQERAADELGALALIETGQGDALQQAAVWMALLPEPPAMDSHPSSRARAWELMCLEDGSSAWGTPECVTLYSAVRARWAAELRGK